MYLSLTNLFVLISVLIYVPILIIALYKPIDFMAKYKIRERRYIKKINALIRENKKLKAEQKSKEIIRKVG